MRKLLLIGTATVLFAALAVTAIFAQTSTSARPWLGVRVVETDGGVVVAQVQAGSPAEAASLLVDDVIVAFNGGEITSASDLARAVQAATAGATVTLDILRDGSPLTLDLTLGTSSEPALGSRGSGLAGDALAPLNFTERLLQASLEAADNGYQVTAVSDTLNPFGLQVGDVVTAVNGQAITALDPSALQFDPRSGSMPTLTLTVLRAGVETTLEADLAFARFVDDDGRAGDHHGERFGGEDFDDEHFGDDDFGGEGFDGEHFGDDDFGGGLAPQTAPDSTPAPLTLGNA